MQIQACTFVLGDFVNNLVPLGYRIEGEGEMHKQLAVIASLAQDVEHVHVIVRSVLTCTVPLLATRSDETSP